MARKLDISGRSTLSKDGLIDAIMKRQARSRKPLFGRGTAKAKTSKKAGASKKATTKKAAPKKAATKKATATKKAAPKKRAAAKKPAPRRRATRESALEAARTEAIVEHPLTAGEPYTPPAYPPRPTTEHHPHIPARYGEDHIALMVRDPYWLHTYWEVTPETLDELRGKLGKDWQGHRRVLRVFTFEAGTAPSEAVEGNGEDRYDIDLPPEVVSWYVNVGRPEHTYRVAVGIIDRRGTFHAIARSNAVITPRDQASHITDEEWANAPETFKRLYEMAAPMPVQHTHSSADMGMLLRDRLQADWSSGMLASMGSGSHAGGAPVRGFWFVVDAELIVYGATEPDANVTVQGQPVQLRPDGTFSLRFQLPDGTQVIDATAESADGVFRKTITPTVRRETTSTEMIENDKKQRARR